MAITLQNVLDSLGNRLKDISDVPQATFIEWCNFANTQVYRHVLSIESERYLLSQTYVVSTSPQTVTLPDDFKSIKPLACGIYERDNSGKDTETSLGRTGFGSEVKGYYFDRANLVFTGIESALTYVLRYAPTVFTFTALTDTFTTDGLATGQEIIPNEYLQFLVEDILVLYNQWDEQGGNESLADFRFSRLLNEYSQNIRRDPSSYDLPDFSQVY